MTCVEGEVAFCRNPKSQALNNTLMTLEIFKHFYATHVWSLRSSLFLLVILFVPIVPMLATQGCPWSHRVFMASFYLASFRRFSGRIQHCTVHSWVVVPNSAKSVVLQAIYERSFQHVVRMNEIWAMFEDCALNEPQVRSNDRKRIRAGPSVRRVF